MNLSDLLNVIWLLFLVSTFLPMITKRTVEARRRMVIDALERKRGVWRRVAADTGVSYSWISQFVRNKIPNPGYATLVKLRDELAKKPAKVPV